MKQQIERFSLHQNAKVFGVLTALSSLIVVLPLMLVGFASAPAQSRPPAFLLLLAPVMYLVMSYVMVIVGCAIYNFMFRYIGGIEFQTRGDEA